ncbi:bifunctional (p)ppGpp synthetase/guanosine-3',5'-bis(diphosphate) 3'-pyrophosphohydrolase [Candidatus Kuenenbacteria bacterium]|nr:bifunctional (p)ppGpp synthetase/guanosine-3',5'-bis(diphosphate) 3'-pyrophosphohydrolase [Candidatus Kuenenbacteria bacterium]
MTIERILEVIKSKHPDIDLTMIQLAYEVAEKAHAGQKRASGEDYIQHPLETAYKLAEMDIDMPTIIAGLLHDVPEETSHTLEEIKKDFGSEVADLVAGITKLGTIKYRGLERYAENLRKMFVAMAEDVRVVFIKFADRIHNLKTLYSLRPVKQQRIAKETLEIYAPIANRLGMNELQNEMEDLAFPYVYPEEYKWVIAVSKRQYAERQRDAETIIKKFKSELRESGLEEFNIYGRAKRYYSLYQKLLRKDMDIDRIYDLVAVRIIVNTTDECYRALGIIHSICKPMTGRVKDYIAQPKPNGYRSLHTTVYYDNKIVEFQIRTKDMEAEAEWGIAAHWTFKEKSGRRTKIPVDPEKLKWIKSLLKPGEETHKPEEYLDKLKIDFFKSRIFVFTPKGDVIDLPEGAIPIDFAYHIHTYIGDHATAAKINGKMETLITPLKSGDMVEITVDKKRVKPAEEWLNEAQTNLAKEKIKQALKKGEGLSAIFKFFGN